MKQLIGLALLGFMSLNAQAAVYYGNNFSIETEETNATIVNDIFTINYNKSLSDAYGISGKLIGFDTPFTLSVNQGWEVSYVKLTINTSYELMVDLSAMDHPTGVGYNAQTSLSPITLASVYDSLNKPASPVGSNPVYSGQQSDANSWSYQWYQGLRGDAGYWLSSTLYVYAFVGTSAATVESVSIQFITSPVPEPSSYAMLGLGLGLVGFAARRRKTK